MTAHEVEDYIWKKGVPSIRFKPVPRFLQDCFPTMQVVTPIPSKTVPVGFGLGRIAGPFAVLGRSWRGLLQLAYGTAKHMVR
jgi:hypothetical protein